MFSVLCSLTVCLANGLLPTAVPGTYDSCAARLFLFCLVLAFSVMWCGGVEVAVSLLVIATAKC